MAKPRLPKEIKEKRGTLEKSRELANPMSPVKTKVGPITIPAYLNKYGKSFYKFYHKTLTDVGVLTVTDLEALGMMSSEYGRYIEAQYILKSEGMVTIGTNKNGSEYSMVSPYISIANNAYKNFYNMMGRFGVSPADRQKISSYVPSSDGDENSLDNFLK